MDTGTFKKMVRLLEIQRRIFFEQEWAKLCRGSAAADLSPRQLNYLMMLRFTMPCNLNGVMRQTGLSSSAASIFVNKLVKAGVLCRKTDPADRRNILVFPTGETKRLIEAADAGLDDFIDERIAACAPDEIEAIGKTGEIICRELEKNPELKIK